MIRTLHESHHTLNGISKRTVSTPWSMLRARLPRACFLPAAAFSVECFRGS